MFKTTRHNSNIYIENCQAYVIEEMKRYFLNNNNKLEQEEIKNLIVESEEVQAYYNNITKLLNSEIDIWDFHTFLHNALVILYPDRNILKECSYCGSEKELIEFHQNKGKGIYYVCYKCLDELDSKEEYIDKVTLDSYQVTTVSDSVDMTDSINQEEELPF